MSLHTFMRVHEAARAAFPAELASLRIPNPRLRHYTFFMLLEGLRKDWRDEDPGKSKPHYFFVRDLATEPARFGPSTELAWCDAMWVAEAVDDLAAARAGNPFWCGYRQTRPRPVPLGSFDDVLRVPCPDCGKGALTVGSYDQTRNSIEYDEWMLSTAVLCLACAKVSKPVHVRSECRRMIELLSRPA